MADIRVQTLVDLIHEYHRGYDQEVFSNRGYGFPLKMTKFAKSNNDINK